MSIRKEVEKMSKRPENMHCADCRAPKPNWASCSLGTFICFNCSGLHRGLGTHLSFVRSVTLDEWTQKQANVMQLWGNANANSFFEARMPPDFKKPDQHASVNVMNKFIRDKYERCKWAADDPAGDPRRGGKPAAAGPPVLRRARARRAGRAARRAVARGLFRRARVRAAAAGGGAAPGAAPERPHHVHVQPAHAAAAGLRGHARRLRRGDADARRLPPAAAAGLPDGRQLPAAHGRRRLPAAAHGRRLPAAAARVPGRGRVPAAAAADARRLPAAGAHARGLRPAVAHARRLRPAVADAGRVPAAAAAGADAGRLRAAAAGADARRLRAAAAGADARRLRAAAAAHGRHGRRHGRRRHGRLPRLPAGPAAAAAAAVRGLPAAAGHGLPALPLSRPRPSSSVSY